MKNAEAKLGQKKGEKHHREEYSKASSLDICTMGK
jgi:hypothetical protein